MSRHTNSWLICLILFASSCANDGAPEFVEVSILAHTESHLGPYEVLATIVDDTAVERVSLFFDINDGVITEVPMEQLSGDVWVGSIPGQPAGSVIRYLLLAIDPEGEQSQYPPEGADPNLNVFRVRAN